VSCDARGPKRSARLFAASTAPVLPGQAEPIARGRHPTPLTPSGWWLARPVLACQSPFPASTLPMPKSPWKLVISVAPGRSRQNARSPNQARTRRNECEPVHNFQGFCGRQRPARKDPSRRPISILADVRRRLRPGQRPGRSASSAGSARGIPVFGERQTWPGQLVVIGGARTRSTRACVKDAERARPDSLATRDANSPAAEQNAAVRLRRSGDIIIRHDLRLEYGVSKRLSSLKPARSLKNRGDAK
jgi:hypothetical protein